MRRRKGPKSRNPHGLTIEDLEIDGGKQVPRVDAAQLYLVGQEDSVKGKHTQLICESLNRILLHAGELDLKDIPPSMSSLRFADPKYIRLECFKFDEPDMIVVRHQEPGDNISLRAVLEFKTWWTGCDLSAPDDNGNNQGQTAWLGQLVHYMNQARKHQDLYWMSLVASDYYFEEKIDKNQLLIAMYQQPSDPSTPHSSPRRKKTSKSSPLSSSRPSSSGQHGATGGASELPILKHFAEMSVEEGVAATNGHEGSMTFNGVDAAQLDADLEACKIVDRDGTCTGWFTKDEKISRRVFKGTYIRVDNGERVPAIMKVFPPEEDFFFDCGLTPSFHWELTASIKMNGSGFTPPFIASGRSKGGYTTLGGDVVIRGICPGTLVPDEVWDSLTPATKDNPILDAMKAALQRFREKDLFIFGIWRDDVLWDASTGQLTVVDLETANPVSAEGCETRDDYELRRLIPAFRRVRKVD
ncbi:hypothetical protein TWF696_007613 [Orbilia brochopaga]|uniref:Uncharacterized protein n=1 Tax=Orbilia brochopaga TaxID=3140254 RepID=A0AAV9UKN1_9PEZI